MSDSYGLREQIEWIIDHIEIEDGMPSPEEREKIVGELWPLVEDVLEGAHIRGYSKGAVVASKLIREAKAEALSEFVGSSMMATALHQAVRDHRYDSEIPPPDSPVEPYLWCVCGWRSDDLDEPWHHAAALLDTHLTNALHAAVVKAIRARADGIGADHE